MASIGYDIKDGIKYAKITVSKRIDGQVITEQTYLGCMLDENRVSFSAENAVSSPTIRRSFTPGVHKKGE